MNSTGAQHQKLVRESWGRCREFGLQHDAKPELQKLQLADTNILLEKQRSLIQTTDHAVLPYYDNILNNSPCLILLADSRGHVLNSWGERRFLSNEQSEWFAAGANWRELSTGTNAIGTALAAGEAVQIQRDEHFLKRHRYMIGSASPIYNAHNELLGVLDISSDTYMPQAHTLGMVRLMSQSIENRLIIDQYQDDYHLVTFNTHFDNLDSQWSGLIVYNSTGQIIAFNRRAELLINHQLANTNIEQIFDCNLKGLEGQIKEASFAVRVLGKYQMYANIQRPTNASLSNKSLAFPNYLYPQKTAGEIAFAQLQFGDSRLKRAIAQAEKVVEKDIPILIFGETGVGKEVFVKALHQHSSRSKASLVALNCAAIPAHLVESELFGYVKGAFTGADSKGSIGLVRKANKGILFLDEIGDMPLSVQARLLRVLQERKVTPLGSTQSYPVDVKLVSATNCNLKELVAKGEFRKDLFYRVSGLNIEIPPLKDRQDKGALFANIIRAKSESEGQLEIDPQIMMLFLAHPWPGNIRQFISVLEVALAMADGDPIENWHLPDDFYDDLKNSPAEFNAQAQFSDQGELSATDNVETFADFVLTEQKTEIGNVLYSADQLSTPGPQDQRITEDVAADADTSQCYQRCNGNLSKTAKALGISRNTLYKRLRLLGLK